MICFQNSNRIESNIRFMLSVFNFIGFPVVCISAFAPFWVVGPCKNYAIVPNPFPQQSWANTSGGMMISSVVLSIVLLLLFFVFLFLTNKQGRGISLQLCFLLSAIFSAFNAGVLLTAYIVTLVHFDQPTYIRKPEDIQNTGSAVDASFFCFVNYLLMSLLCFTVFLLKECNVPLHPKDPTTVPVPQQAMRDPPFTGQCRTTIPTAPSISDNSTPANPPFPSAPEQSSFCSEQPPAYSSPPPPYPEEFLYPVLD